MSQETFARGLANEILKDKPKAVIWNGANGTGIRILAACTHATGMVSITFTTNIASRRLIIIAGLDRLSHVGAEQDAEEEDWLQERLSAPRALSAAVFRHMILV